MFKRKDIYILTLPQVEQVLQVVCDSVHDGKPSYTKYEVLKLIRMIYNQFVKTGTVNAQTGFHLSVEGGDTDATV